MTALELPADLPFGLFPGTHYRSTQLTLRPGDRVVLITDDATILCLDWHGTHNQERSVVAGADPDRASDPLV